MKKDTIRIVRFVCMVIVLGTQALLHGSWKIQQVEALNSKNERE